MRNRRLLERVAAMLEAVAVTTPAGSDRPVPQACAALLQVMAAIEIDFDIPRAHWPRYFAARLGVEAWANGGGGAIVAAGLETLRGIVRDALAVPTPRLESRFPVVADPAFRAMLEADYGEAERCLDERLWKSAVVLFGSVLEAAIIDRLRSNPEWTMRGKEIPRRRGGGQRDIQSEERDDEWTLFDMLKFCSANGVLAVGADTALGHFVRTPRNSIHPRASVRLSAPIGEIGAKASKATVDQTLDDLARSKFPPALPAA